MRDLILYKPAQRVRLSVIPSPKGILLSIPPEYKYASVYSVSRNGVPVEGFKITDEGDIYLTPSESNSENDTYEAFLENYNLSIPNSREDKWPSFAGIGNSVTVIGGEISALQKFHRTINMDPGSDYENPDRGCGLRSIISGSLVNPSSRQDLFSRVQIAIDSYNKWSGNKNSRSSSGSIGVNTAYLRSLYPVRNVSSTEYRGMTGSIYESIYVVDLNIILSNGTSYNPSLVYD